MRTDVTHLVSFQLKIVKLQNNIPVNAQVSSILSNGQGATEIVGLKHFFFFCQILVILSV